MDGWMMSVIHETAPVPIGCIVHFIFQVCKLISSLVWIDVAIVFAAIVSGREGGCGQGPSL